MGKVNCVDLTLTNPAHARTLLNRLRQSAATREFEVVHRPGDKFDASPFVLLQPPMPLPDGKLISSYARRPI